MALVIIQDLKKKWENVYFKTVIWLGITEILQGHVLVLSTPPTHFSRTWGAKQSNMMDWDDFIPVISDALRKGIT